MRSTDRMLRTTQWTRASSIRHLRVSDQINVLARFDESDHWSCPTHRKVCQGTIHTHVCGQVSKSKRWMPWHLEPKKDVAICDKPRGVDKRTSIRGSPNGETPPGVVIRPGDSRLNI